MRSARCQFATLRSGIFLQHKCNTFRVLNYKKTVYQRPVDCTIFAWEHASVAFRVYRAPVRRIIFASSICAGDLLSCPGHFGHIELARNTYAFYCHYIWQAGGPCWIHDNSICYSSLCVLELLQSINIYRKSRLQGLCILNEYLNSLDFSGSPED